MPNIVKNTTNASLLDLIAPHSCRGCGRIGTILCDRCKNYILSKPYHICPNCKKPSPTHHCQKCTDLPPSYIIGERSGLIGDIIHAYKYDSVRSLATPLAELLAKTLPNLPKNSVIVPLPTIGRHIRARGFDHTLLIAKHLSKLTPAKVSPILTRAKDTVQVGADSATRKTQARKAYTLTTPSLNSTTTYILLDDVWTTGASMRSATEKLQQAGASQIILAILSLSQIN